MVPWEYPRGDSRRELAQNSLILFVEIEKISSHLFHPAPWAQFPN